MATEIDIFSRILRSRIDAPMTPHPTTTALVVGGNTTKMAINNVGDFSATAKTKAQRQQRPLIQISHRADAEPSTISGAPLANGERTNGWPTTTILVHDHRLVSRTGLQIPPPKIQSVRSFCFPSVCLCAHASRFAHPVIGGLGGSVRLFVLMCH